METRNPKHSLKKKKGTMKELQEISNTKVVKINQQWVQQKYSGLSYQTKNKK